MLDHLLERSSRTFALSIPLLPEPCRTEVTLAYLLFRVADTLEDENAWPVDQRLAMLEALGAALDSGSGLAGIAETITALDTQGLSEPGYAELLERLPAVLDAWAETDDHARALISAHLARTIRGMAQWLRQDTGPATVAEVRDYGYIVAGIVGELCTELFIRQSPALRDRRADLLALAPAFGETLQLVNILRDEADDADHGRQYIPGPAARAELEAVAAQSLAKATRYIATLEATGAAPGIVAFNALNLALAKETLALVAKLGPGVKLPRERVTQLHSMILALTASGESMLDLLQ